MAVCTQAQVGTNSQLDSLRNKFQEETAQDIREFDKFSEEARAEYERYEQQMRNEYFSYINSIKEIWGNDSIIDDTPTEWVEYSNDKKSRSIVDFDKGNILVQIAIDDIHKYDSTEIENRLADAIEKILDSRGSTCPYKSTVDISEKLSARPILEGLVDFSRYDIDNTAVAQTDEPEKPKNARPTPPTPKIRGKELNIVQQERETTETATNNKQQETLASRMLREQEKKKKAEDIAVQKEEARRQANAKAKEKYKKTPTVTIAKAVAKQSVKKTATVTGTDNKKRTVVQVQMSLVSDNISKNAALYKDFVSQYSQTFQIEQPLIFAVMEQESRFNPEATSHIPAYGLMQLVPRSGGYDAYRYVYKREWAPTKSYLFVPNQNIELGTAYLRVLMNQFANVSDPDCRRLCVIASYNTGAGNVSRSFTGNTNIKKAIPLINKYSYQQLYNHLVSNLSTSEARNYVKGVSSRREKYLK